jgi:tetratricopeptide (TPR) repeat protein
MMNRRKNLQYISEIVLIFIFGLFLAGCSIFSYEKPKPVPQGEVRFYLQEGDKYLSAGNYNKAIESYSGAADLDPESVEARRKLGELYISLDKLEAALEQFTQIIQIDPSYSYAYNYRGFIYNNQEKWAEAVKEFKAALEVDPENVYSLNHLGLMYKRMERFEDAKEVLQEAIELDPEMDTPDSKDTHNYLGLVYQDQGEYEKAEAEFRKVLEHFPNDADTFNYLGTALENQGKYQDAAKQYQEVLDIKPEDEFAKSRLEELQLSGVILIEIPPVEIVKDDVEQYIASAPGAYEYPDAGAVILLDKLSYEFTESGAARYTVHQIVKVLNERGISEFGEVYMYFNAKTQNIGVNVARTILPNGTIVEAPRDAYHDITPPGLAEYNLYSDLMIKVISMPALEPGAILEYKITVEDAMESELSWILGSMSFQWIEPVLNSKCVLHLPKDVEIRWKSYNLDIEPVITVGEDESLTYIWITKDNTPVFPEIAMPPLSEIAKFMMFSTTESWDDVYEWYKELADTQYLINKEIKGKISELITGKDSKANKAKAIFEFVASEIRYVAIELGMGAYQPYPAADVFKYRYGDCKDKVTLLIAMLREAGIDAYPVLISPAPHRKVDTDIPSIGQFSHVIAAVQMEDNYIFLDPTVATCSYGDLPAGDQGRQAFVIGKDRGDFIETPVYPSEANKTISTSEITMMEDGTINGWEQTTATGQAEMYLRSVYRLVTPDRRKEFMQIVLNQRYPGVQIQEISISDLYDLDKPLEVRVDFSCPEYGSEYEEMLIFPVPSEDFSAYAPLVGLLKRQYDLYLGYNMVIEKQLTLSIPEGYITTSLPRDKSVDHELGNFMSKYEKLDSSTVRYSVSLKLDAPVVSPEDYSGFKNFMEAAAREDRAHIILKRSGSALGL